jgi:MFS family permease
VNLAIGVFFGSMQISVTAFALEHGAAAAAAPVFMASSCASLLAGWLYGLRRWRTAPRVQLAVVAAGMAAACLPLLVAGSLLELGLSVTLTGVEVPLVLVLCSVLAESAVHRALLTQAFVWLSSATAAGSAGAAALAGWSVDAFGARGGFTVAAAATSVMAVLAVTGLRALRVPRPAAAHEPGSQRGLQPGAGGGQVALDGAFRPVQQGGDLLDPEAAVVVRQERVR